MKIGDRLARGVVVALSQRGYYWVRLDEYNRRWAVVAEYTVTDVTPERVDTATPQE